MDISLLFFFPLPESDKHFRLALVSQDTCESPKFPLDSRWQYWTILMWYWVLHATPVLHTLTHAHPTMHCIPLVLCTWTYVFSFPNQIQL